MDRFCENCLKISFFNNDHEDHKYDTFFCQADSHVGVRSKNAQKALSGQAIFTKYISQLKMALERDISI